MLLKTPSSLEEIIHVFGSLDSPTFERDNIVKYVFPYPLSFAGQRAISGRCHKLLVDNFDAVFKEIMGLGLQSEFTNYAGIYQPRPIRGMPSHPSTHSWGIAIDGDAAKYHLGDSVNRYPQQIVEVFRKYGFFYGGDFKHRKDPMHFQFAINY